MRIDGAWKNKASSDRFLFFKLSSLPERSLRNASMQAQNTASLLSGHNGPRSIEGDHQVSESPYALVVDTRTALLQAA
jgi:hypothetical protein